MRGSRGRAQRVTTWQFFTGTSGNDWTFPLMFTCGQEGVFQPGYVSRVWAGLFLLSVVYVCLEGTSRSLSHCSSLSLVAKSLGHTLMDLRLRCMSNRLGRMH